MLLPSLLTLLLCLRPFANCIGFHGFTYQGMDEPEPLSLNQYDAVREKWIVQPLDHFNHRDNRTWSMRYMQNDKFYKGTGPILITIGGEWTISSGSLRAGIMYEIASTHGGMMYYTEHRYYGQSKPTKDISSTNLQYLNVDQALADLAYFIEMKKKEVGKDTRVYIFGGSYAGNMATWARLKYPHLIQGALASSAPVFAKADFYEYYEVVTRSLARYDEQCVTDVKAAIDSVEELLKSEDGPEKLKTYFNLCETPNVNSRSDVAYFMNLLAEVFAGVVQYDKLENGITKVAACCNNMTALHLGSPLQRLAHLIRGSNNKCIDGSYGKFVVKYRDESWNERNDAMRQWFYQTCTEYGYYATTNSDKSIFGTLFPLSFFTDMCSDLYGDYYDHKFLNTRVRRTNLMYGGARPDLTNVIFSNGDLDPWHALSVLEDLNERTPAILIKGSSHCRDLYTDLPTDGEDLKLARARIRKIIGDWISS